MFSYECTTEDIKSLTQLIVEAINPIKVILYGSYVWGIPQKIDILVVMQDEELTFEEITDLSCKVISKNRERPVYIKNNLCILAQSDYREMREVPISQIYYAYRNGVVLYDKGKESQMAVD